MVKYSLKEVKYIASAPTVQKLPQLKDSRGKLVPEIAVIGRSNVGKSSLLNMLFQSKGLVKTSSTPGKTRGLNLFALQDVMAFVDLPGYGYAAVSDAVRQEWGPMIQGYLEKREALALIFYLFDIRRDVNDEDRQLMQWFTAQNKAVILIVTKSDKISKGKIAGRCKQIVEGFQVQNLHVVPCSATTHAGRDDVLRILFDAVKNEYSS